MYDLSDLPRTRRVVANARAASAASVRPYRPRYHYFGSKYPYRLSDRGLTKSIVREQRAVLRDYVPPISKSTVQYGHFGRTAHVPKDSVRAKAVINLADLRHVYVQGAPGMPVQQYDDPYTTLGVDVTLLPPGAREIQLPGMDVMIVDKPWDGFVPSGAERASSRFDAAPTANWDEL